jgi:hypothetical protein
MAEPTLQFRTSEVLDHILPIWRVVISSQVGLQFSTQYLEGSALSNTVGANQTQNLSGSRGRQSMKLEAVGRVSMGDMGLEVGRQIDDVDCSKGAFFRANTAANAQTLGDEGNLRFGSDFDAETTTSNNGARLFAFLSAFLYRACSADIPHSGSSKD